MGAGRIATLTRNGQARPLDMPVRTYGVLDLSPDGNRLAIHVSDVTDYIWVYDLLRQEGTRLTKPGLNCGWPIWSPDGREVLFAAGEGTNWAIYRQPAEPSAEPQALLKVPPFAGLAYVAKEQLLMITLASMGGGRLVNLTNPAVEQVLTRGNEQRGVGRFSLDSRRITYSNDRLGQSEVWVRFHPDDGKDEKVSLDGGGEPVWANTNDVVYRKENELFLVQLSPNSNRPVAPPCRVFVAEGFVDTPGLSYAVSANAERLYFVQAAAHPVRDRLYVIQNWFAELRERAPPKRRL